MSKTTINTAIREIKDLKKRISNRLTNYFSFHDPEKGLLVVGSLKKPYKTPDQIKDIDKFLSDNDFQGIIYTGENDLED